MAITNECINEVKLQLKQLEKQPDQFQKLVRNMLFTLAEIPEENEAYATFRMVGRNVQNTYKSTIAAQKQFNDYKKGIEQVKVDLEYLLRTYE